jgi:hypothetical protein
MLRRACPAGRSSHADASAVATLMSKQQTVKLAEFYGFVEGHRCPSPSERRRRIPERQMLDRARLFRARGRRCLINHFSTDRSRAIAACAAFVLRRRLESLNFLDCDLRVCTLAEGECNDALMTLQLLGVTLVDTPPAECLGLQHSLPVKQPIIFLGEAGNVYEQMRLR